MLDTLKKHSFDPHLNSKFEIHTESVGKVDVELVEVTESKQSNQDSFSVIFRGPKEKAFEQKIHHVKHPKMGEFDLFLVPIIHPKQDGMYYQAVFCRLK